MKEKKKMLKGKVKQKKDWKTKDDFFWSWFFREKKVKGEKGWTRNFKKRFKIKKVYFTHSFQKKKKQENRKRKKHGRKGKSRRCLLQFVGWKTTFFQIHHNKQAKMRKLEKTFFQDTEKQDKMREEHAWCLWSHTVWNQSMVWVETRS